MKLSECRCPDCIDHVPPVVPTKREEAIIALANARVAVRELLVETVRASGDDPDPGLAQRVGYLQATVQSLDALDLGPA